MTPFLLLTSDMPEFARFYYVQVVLPKLWREAQAETLFQAPVVFPASGVLFVCRGGNSCHS